MQAWSKSPTAILRSGDLVNIDVSAELDRYWADTGASVAVGEVAPQHRRLLEATAAAQRDAMGVAGAGRPMRHIGRAVERRARRAGFSSSPTWAGTASDASDRDALMAGCRARTSTDL